MSKKSAGSSKQQARQQLRAERERQAAIAKRRDRIIKTSIVAVVVLALAGVGGLVYWQSTSESEPGAVPSDAIAGDQADAGGPDGMGSGISVGDPDAPVVMEIYEDFMCPACQAFEAQAGPTIDDLVESADVHLVRYPLSSGAFGEPSRAAANAYGCAVDEGVGAEYHKTTLTRGMEESIQWDDDQLVELGAQVGADSAQFEQCVQDREYEDWTDSINDNGQERGVPGTPTLYIDGEEVAFAEGDVPAEIITQRVEQARDGAAE